MEGLRKTGTFLQVGVTAMRGPDGKFLPAVPLYIEADTQAVASEEALIGDIGRLFAARMKAYVEGCKAAGVSV
ncbi:MAG: hypothetical protein IJ313_10530 [Clostridia bacterium]|nr:hypothetical protein [Clostridia bacterium]